MRAVRRTLGVVMVTGLTACGVGGEPSSEVPRPSSADAGRALDKACAIALSAPGATGATGLDAQIMVEIERSRTAASRPVALERLGWLYVAKARRSQDAAYYVSALYTSQCMQGGREPDPGALLLEGHANYSLHRFSRAQAIARRLVTTRTNAFDYGLLGDTHLSQGEIGEAVVAYQQMMDLQPGLQAYSRAAQVRWLTGDLDGARQLMRMAVRAASPRDSQTLSWALAELARFHLVAGDLPAASATARQAVDVAPDHAGALLTRGRVDLAAGRLDDAIRGLRDAVAIGPSTEALWVLADALRASGDTSRASDVERRLLDQGPTEDPRTTALYLATRRLDPRLAVMLASRERESRADPHTVDALGWALSAAGETAAARRHLVRALSHGTVDARLFLHAAVAAAQAGDDVEASRWFAEATRHRTSLLPSEQDWLPDSSPEAITPAPAR